jgi:hypothetical protein
VAENPANSNYVIVLDASVKRSMESKGTEWSMCIIKKACQYHKVPQTSDLSAGGSGTRDTGK